MSTLNDFLDDDEELLLKPAEVANRLRVSPKTVTQWAKEGRIPCVVLPSGHRRYRLAVVEAILQSSTDQT